MKIGKYIIAAEVLFILINVVLYESVSHLYLLISQFILLGISIMNYSKIQSIFSPINIFIIACEISFTIKGLNILHIGKFSNENFNSAFILYMLFILGVMIGLKIKTVRKSNNIDSKIMNRNINQKKFFRFFVISVPLCIVLYIMMLGTYNLSEIFSNLLNNRILFQNSGGLYLQTVILSLLKICVYVSVIFVFDKEKWPHSKSVLIISLLVLVFIAASLGGRGEIVFPFIAILFLYERIKNKIDIKKLLAFGVVILLFSGWYGLLRDGEDVQNITLSDNINNVLNRYVQLDNLIRLSTNPVEYGFGQSFKDFLLSPIPRNLLPNKPYPFNSQMTKIYLPEQFERKIVSDFTTIGELYLNFGYVGITVGGIIYGIILNFIIYIYINNKSRFFMILYPFLMLKPMSILYGGMINSNANMMLILEFCFISAVWYLITDRSVKCYEK